MESANNSLERNLGAKTLAINAVNLTIGAGIFLLPAHVAGYLGSMSFLAYLFCALLMGLIMMCFAEMQSISASSGGAYAIIEDAFGPLAGFLANTLIWFGYSVLADAAVLNAMTDMLGIWFPIFNVYWIRVVFLFVVLGIFTFVNVRGATSGARMVLILTIIKLTPLILLIVLGVFKIQGANLALTTMPDISTFGAACLLLFFAFGGSETALNNSGEFKDPAKSIPKGIFMGMTGILIIYLLLQLVASGILGDQLGDYTAAPLAEVAIRIVGPFGGTVLIATAVIAMYSMIGGDILASSRLPFAAANDGLLPSQLARIHPKFKTPHVSIIFFSTAMFVMAISGGFKTLAILASSATLLIYLGVVLAMFKHRFKAESVSPFRAPGGWIVPISSLAVVAWLLSYIPLKEVIALSIFFGIVTVFFFVFKKLK